jgi:hypothetical protein
MAQVPIIETGYLVGVLAAFAAFALTLFIVALYARQPRRPRIAKAAEFDGLIVRGEAVLILD